MAVHLSDLTMATQITVQTKIHAPVEKVWEHYTNPDSITKWNFASEDWCCPRAESDLRPGGKFSSRMEAKDGSAGFDFAGEFIEVEPNKMLSYQFGDRKAVITFNGSGESTDVTVTFDAEKTNSEEMQRQGWQSILNQFKSFVETLDAQEAAKPADQQ